MTLRLDVNIINITQQGKEYILSFKISFHALQDNINCFYEDIF